MVKRSRLEHVAGNPGDNVIIPIPLVDRGKGDPCNIMGVIVDRNQNDSYSIAVHAGLLKGRYSRNQFDLCNQKLYTLSDMCTDIEVGLRHAVKEYLSHWVEVRDTLLVANDVHETAASATRQI